MSNWIRILAIDGGGMRGVIPGEVLIALEDRLQKRTGDPHARLADFFDLVAGTSTGGIAVALFLCPDPKHPRRARYTAREVSDLLVKGGGEIFNIPLWQKLRSLGGLTDERYPVEPLERILTAFLGKVRLSQLVRPCLITAYDMQRRRTHFFTQVKAARSRQHDFLAKDVALATSAAPTFFEVANIRSQAGGTYPMIDGGVLASNPSMCAFAEAQKFPGRPTARQMLLLSVGTGQVTTPYDFQRVKHWGIFDWLQPLLDIFMTGVAETTDYQLRRLFAAEGVSHQYLRVNPSLDGRCSPELDNASPSNLRNLQAAGRRVVREQGAELNRFADLLVQAGAHALSARRPRTRRK
jgi:patatin-like phospholipase/acyl hydrolase